MPQEIQHCIFLKEVGLFENYLSLYVKTPAPEVS